MTGHTDKSANPHSDIILHSAGITATLTLAEPTIFLHGFSKSEHLERPPALVRGTLTFHITKPTKIKSIQLIFRGVSRTEWPEGIPSDKTETHESKEVFVHEWTLFSAKFPNADSSSSAHAVNALNHGSGTPEGDALHPMASVPLVNQKDAVSRGFRIFNPAEYIYNIEVLLRQGLPESMDCSFGSVKWGFELLVERQGAFKPNLNAHKEVTLLRALGPSSLEASEPIFINRDWEDLLHYEIVIAGKAFTIGNKFSVNFSFIPLAKVKLHRIRIYMTEHTEYYCRNRRIHRIEPSHKFLLCEKKSPEGNKGNLLDPDNHGMSESIQFDMDVDIPETFPSRKDHLRPNASTKYIKVYHWVKLVMRVSHPERKKNGMPKCYEVSIDSPVTLVDGRTVVTGQLPSYFDSARRRSSGVSDLRPYREFIQNKSNSSAPPAGWFTRKPSIEPPPFDAETLPPQFFPPQYSSIPGVTNYSERYEEYIHAKESSSGEGESESTMSASSSSMNGDQEHEFLGSDIPRDTRVSADVVDPNNLEASTTTTAPLNSEGRPVFSHVIWTEDSRMPNSGSDEDDIDPADPTPIQSPYESQSGSSTAVSRTNTNTDAASSTSESSMELRTPPASAPAQSPALILSQNQDQHQLPMPPAMNTLNGKPKPRNALSRQLSNLSLERIPSSTNSLSSWSMKSALSSAGGAADDTNEEAVVDSESLSPPNVRPSQGLVRTGSAGSFTSMPQMSPNLRAYPSPAQLQKLRKPLRLDNNMPIFSEKYMDRRGSSGSASMRYFRQSSIVSVDLTKQNSSRRPSHVGSVEELTDGLPLRRIDSNGSFAVSVSEYQRLPDWGQGNAPLLGDGEVDMGLDWEHDYEDYEYDDRRSIASSFYAMVSP